MYPEHIARVCHEVNKAYCESQGDMSQVPWEQAPEWQKESARKGVNMHLGGEFGPEETHHAWLVHKRSEGWTYGKVKDERKKTHPCLVPFADLPPAQQAKDFIFRAVVLALRQQLPKEYQNG